MFALIIFFHTLSCTVADLFGRMAFTLRQHGQNENETWNMYLRISKDLKAEK